MWLSRSLSVFLLSFRGKEESLFLEWRLYTGIQLHRRMRRGGRGGSCPPPQIRANSGWNSGKQWVKFGQSKKKKSARESYKLTPLECWWWRHTGNVQGGGACGYLCKISGKSTPLPPLTKAFPYAYVQLLGSIVSIYQLAGKISVLVA